MGSGATIEVTGGRTTTEAEAEVIINEAITRIEEEEEAAVAMVTRATGRVAVEAGTIATMTRTATHTAPGGDAHAPAHPKSAQAVAAAPTALTAHLQGDPDAPATHLGPVPHPHIIAATRASLAPRMLKTS